jgi:hypothetical protein
MRSDPYQTYIETLNSGEPYPPFQEIRDLVMQQNGRRKAVIAPFYKYATVVVLFAALGLFIGNHFLANESLPNTQMTHPLQMTHPSQVTYPSHLPDGPVSTNVATHSPKNATIQSEDLQTGITNNTTEKQNASTTPQHSTVDIAAAPSDTKAVQTITTPTVASSTTLAQLSEQNGVALHHWSAYFSGGSILPGNSYSASAIFGAVGVRYRIFGSSSFVIELRRSSFIVNHAAQSGGLRDTTLTVGGASYPATIGSPSQLATSATSQVNSLDVGYRFDLSPNEVLSPCAEVLAGASNVGFLSSEAAGIEYRFANGFSLDASARAEQLFSPPSIPLTVLGFEAGIAFQW